MTPEQTSVAHACGFRRLSAPLMAMTQAPPGSAGTAELVVRVTGLSEPLVQVGCSLFAGPAGFPKDNAGARQLWKAADTKEVVIEIKVPK